MVSGEVENCKEQNEVNNLFLGPSLNRITNDFSVTNGVFYSLALAHIHNPFLSCPFFLIFFILLHMFGLFFFFEVGTLMECEDVIKFGEIFWRFIIGKKNVPGTFQYGNYEQVHIEIFNNTSFSGFWLLFQVVIQV